MRFQQVCRKMWWGCQMHVSPKPAVAWQPSGDPNRLKLVPSLCHDIVRCTCLLPEGTGSHRLEGMLGRSAWESQRDMGE